MIARAGCLQCGAQIQFDEFGYATSCPKCGTAHRLPRDSSGAWIASFAFNLNMQQATAAAAGIIRRKLGGARRADFDIIERYPLYLPVWRFTARAQGWFVGKEGRTLPIMIEKNVRIPAYDSSYAGFPEIRDGTEAAISPETEFPVMKIKVKTDMLTSKAKELLAAEVSSATGNSGAVSYSADEPVLSLHPAWIFRFRTVNGEHTLVLDGLTGTEINNLDIRLRDERQPAEIAFAAGCGAVSGLGIALGVLTSWQGLATGLAVSGIALFTAVHLLRLLLRPSHSRARVKRRWVET